MIAVHENAGGNLTDSTKRALMSVGAGRGDIAVLGSKENVSFAMIGRKGAQSGSVPQVWYMLGFKNALPVRTQKNKSNGVTFFYINILGSLLLIVHEMSP